MKKILKPIFIILLVMFSFFYTDKIMNLINKSNPLMNIIKEKEDVYRLDAIEAVVNDKTIIPGVKGREIDLDKSYEEMKLGGVFREEAIIFKDIYPKNNIDSNLDKYIVKGNSSKKEVSLLYIINNYNDIEIAMKSSDICLFISSKYLDYKVINKLKDKEIYPYIERDNYSEEELSRDNNTINRYAKNKAKYCLLKEENNKILNICQKQKMSSFIPNIIGDYYDVKKDLSSGSIILLNNLNNLDLIKRYISSKGYKITTLSNLLKE